jgi:hypothetical protein
MRKTGIIISACLLAFGCTDYKSQVERLQEEKKAMAYQTAYKDSTIESFMTTINEIEQNLQAIEVKQNIIKRNTNDGELKTNNKARINASIQAINELMDENRAKIEKLNRQVKTSKVKLAQFDRMIGNLNDQLAVKNSEVEDLNQQVLALNNEVQTLHVTVDTLKRESEEKTVVIETQTAELHKAFYTTGTSRELRDKQVITKEGGFLGLGKDEDLKTDFNSAAFTPVDITKVATIELDGKDAKLVTTHPSDSYKIERTDKEVKDLVITDPNKFWSASKYLVVMVDK